MSQGVAQRTGRNQMWLESKESREKQGEEVRKAERGQGARRPEKAV